MGVILTELFGRLLGIGHDGQLVAQGHDITNICANVEFTVAAESPANTIVTSCQFTKADGSALDSVVHCDVFVFADAAGLAVGAGGSTGLTAGTNGAIIDTITAKQHFTFASEDDGTLDLDMDDTGTTAWYLGVKLPGGRMVISPVVQMA